MLIATINKGKNVEELEIYVTPNTVSSNYGACNISINNRDGIKKEDMTYVYFDKYVTLDIDEVCKNCSTVSIHHINNLVSKYYKGLFDDVEEGILFLRAIVTYLKETIRYSNILYTISPESSDVAAEYCKRYANKVYEVVNKRNQHTNTYYCESLV